MSLLLDALKRAEQAKQGSSLSLEPIESANKPANQSNAAMAGVAPGPTLGSAARRAEQEAARTVFTAKQPQMQNRPLWLLLGGLSLLAIAAGVFWLWYVLTYPTVRPPTPSNAPLKSQSLPALPTTAAANAPNKAADAAESPAPDKIKAEIQSPNRPSAAPAVAKSIASTVTPASTKKYPQIKVNIAETVPVSTPLTTAYKALTQGDYPVAQQQYLLVVRDDPFNLDAYLGLATIAASTGDQAAALVYYRRALEIDPKNAVARTGLAAMQTSQNAMASEAQLKANIAADPLIAPTHSALGHLYAGQARWNEAQQSFFDAYRLDPTNPDHAFNLAVSLEHLGQTKPARDYYNKALTLAASRPAGFNAADVAARLNQLPP